MMMMIMLIKARTFNKFVRLVRKKISKANTYLLLTSSSLNVGCWCWAMTAANTHAVEKKLRWSIWKGLRRPLVEEISHWFARFIEQWLKRNYKSEMGEKKKERKKEISNGYVQQMCICANAFGESKTTTMSWGKQLSGSSNSMTPKYEKCAKVNAFNTGCWRATRQVCWLAGRGSFWLKTKRATF